MLHPVLGFGWQTSTEGGLVTRTVETPKKSCSTDRESKNPDSKIYSSPGGPHVVFAEVTQRQRLGTCRPCLTKKLYRQVILGTHLTRAAHDDIKLSWRTLHTSANQAILSSRYARREHQIECLPRQLLGSASKSKVGTTSDSDEI